MTTMTRAEALQADFIGEVIGPESPRYDEARKVWNGNIDRRPLLIARCQGVADVQAALRFAREEGLPVSIRGGGHAVAGHAIAEAGVVIDLTLMRGTRIDPVARTIRLEGGCLNAHLDREAQAFGLAATGGFISHTGIAGLTLGGGIGHLMRKFGLSIDALISCDVVTADGEFVVASERENPDLFWGLRGGGGNFGVVTSFEFQLQPLGPQVLAGMVAWPMAQGPQVLAFIRDFLAEAPDEVGLIGNLRIAPAMPVVPPEVQGTPIIATVLTWAGPVEEGEKVFAPLRSFGTPAFDAVMPKPYAAHQKALDAALPHGRHYYWRSHRLGPLTDDMIGIITEHAGKITSGFSAIGLFCFGGAMARVPADATAFPYRDAAHDINIVGAWAPDDPEPQRHIDWVRGFFSALEPHSRGVYVNFTSDDPADRIRQAAYGPEKWARLVELKSKYDPKNVFRYNANIPPD